MTKGSNNMNPLTPLLILNSHHGTKPQLSSFKISSFLETLTCLWTSRGFILGAGLWVASAHGPGHRGGVGGEETVFYLHDPGMLDASSNLFLLLEGPASGLNIANVGVGI